MKIAVSTYSFYALLEKGELKLMDCVKKVKEMGFDAIEFSFSKPDEEGISKADFAKKLREACEKWALPVANYTIAADFINGRDGGSPEKEAERLQNEVDIAEILGSPGMRHDATWGFNQVKRGWRGFDSVLPQLADGCRAVTEYAATKHIRTMVENHGYFAQDSERVEKLVNTVAHDNFGLLVDMGNFLCADDNPVTAVSRVAPYAFHVHAKDFHVKDGFGSNPGRGFFPSRGGNYLRGAIIGHGNVPVQQCLRIIKQAGYDGYVSIEFEGMEETLSAIAIGLENLRRYIDTL